MGKGKSGRGRGGVDRQVGKKSQSRERGSEAGKEEENPGREKRARTNSAVSNEEA